VGFAFSKMVCLFCCCRVGVVVCAFLAFQVRCVAERITKHVAGALSLNCLKTVVFVSKTQDLWQKADVEHA
jgi:hypothetical protein